MSKNKPKDADAFTREAQPEKPALIGKPMVMPTKAITGLLQESTPTWQPNEDQAQEFYTKMMELHGFQNASNAAISARNLADNLREMAKQKIALERKNVALTISRAIEWEIGTPQAIQDEIKRELEAVIIGNPNQGNDLFSTHCSPDGTIRVDEYTAREIEAWKAILKIRQEDITDQAKN